VRKGHYYFFKGGVGDGRETQGSGHSLKEIELFPFERRLRIDGNWVRKGGEE